MSQYLGSWLRYVARLRLAPFVPSPTPVGETMLTLARLRPNETVLDLGCGDGRLLLKAVNEFGAGKGIGYELDADLVEAARTAAAEIDHHHPIEIHQADALQAGHHIEEADVVMLYLTQRGNEALLPLLRSSLLRPNARVVSYVWDFGDGLPPSRTATATGSGVVTHWGRPNVLLWERDELVLR